MTKAGVAPVIVRLLRGALMKEDERALAGGTDDAVDSDNLDRNGKDQATKRKKNGADVFLPGKRPKEQPGSAV